MTTHAPSVLSAEPLSACPACYTATRTTPSQCPRPVAICDIACPRDVHLPAVTITIPGANPACLATPTVTVACTQRQRCNCQDLMSVNQPTVTVTGAAVNCAAAPAASSPCASYKTIRDGRMCPMIYCVRDGATCAEGPTPTIPESLIPVETEITTRGCTVVEITGRKCNSCPRSCAARTGAAPEARMTGV